MDHNRNMTLAENVQALQKAYLECVESDLPKARQIEIALKKAMSSGNNLLKDDKKVIIKPNKDLKDPLYLPERFMDSRIMVKHRAPPAIGSSKEKLDLAGKLRRFLNSFDKHPDLIFEDISVPYDNERRVTAPSIFRALKHAKIPVTKEESFRVLVLFDKNNRGHWKKDEFLHMFQSTIGPLSTAKYIARHSPKANVVRLTQKQVYTVGQLAMLFGSDNQKATSLFKKIANECCTSRLSASDLYRYIVDSHQCHSIELARLASIIAEFDSTGLGVNQPEFVRMMSPWYRLNQY